MKAYRKGWLGLFLITAFFTSGCLMAGNYHTARTLGKGESSFGLTFSINNLIDDEERVSVPNLVPELTYHIGLAENWEIGGRVALGALGLEMDVKHRFLNTGSQHLALAPSAAYQAFFDFDGVTFRLPLIFTNDFTDNFALNTAVFASYSSLSAEEDWEEDFLYATAGDIVSYGIAFGPEIRGTVFFARPTFEYIRYQTRLHDPEGIWEPFNSYNLNVHFGWVFGREKQQLDRIEQKLDQLRGKSD